MTRTQRIKEKIKAKRNFTTAGVFAGIMIVSLVVGITILAPIENDFHLALFFIGAMILPIAAGMWFTIMGAFARSKLTAEFGRLFDEKNKHYFKLFYDEIVRVNLDAAREAFNLIVLRNDGYRIFAHGMLITIMRLYGDDKRIKEAAERMTKVLE